MSPTSHFIESQHATTVARITSVGFSLLFATGFVFLCCCCCCDVEAFSFAGRTPRENSPSSSVSSSSSSGLTATSNVISAILSSVPAVGSQSMGCERMMMVSSFGMVDAVASLLDEVLVDAPSDSDSDNELLLADRSTRATRSWQSLTFTVSVPTAFLNQAGARKETRKATSRDRGSQAGWL